MKCVSLSAKGLELEAFEAGVKHAEETLCKPAGGCCQHVNVEIECDWGGGLEGFLDGLSFRLGVCGKQKTVDCGKL